MDATTVGREFQKPNFHFDWTEYIVFSLVLITSLAIGIYYGFFEKNNKTNEDFLMGGRSMSVAPVAISLICSLVSAITLLGKPVEIYFYGIQPTLIVLVLIPITLILMYILVPIFFRLQLTSAYEYFEWRFSRRIRVIVSIFALIHSIIYTSTCVYGPSLAVEQLSGINTMVSCGAIFIVCIIYSSLGGFKAVLWSDFLQGVVMMVSLSAIIVVGTWEVGGIPYIWNLATKTDRTNLFIMDTDFRSRYTFWTSIVGGFFTWLPTFTTQSQIQRYNAVPTLRESRLTLFFNTCGMILIMLLCSWIGLILFANYYNCDPVTTKTITSSDQLLPLFAIEVLGRYPGLPGLLLAGLTCGSLSTVSSTLNSTAAIITEDFVKYYKPDLSEKQLLIISKTISITSGIVSFALVFVIAEINKTVNISPFSTMLHGTLLGPIFGAFCLGMFFPISNELGTFLGLISSIFLTAFTGLGNIFAGLAGKLPDQRLSLRTDGCTLVNQTGENIYEFEKTLTAFSRFSDWKQMHQQDSFLLKIWSISYVWQPAVGVLSSFILGLAFSSIIAIIQNTPLPKVNECLLSPHFLKFWKMLFGQKYLNKMVDFTSPLYTGNSAEKFKCSKNEIIKKNESTTS